MPLLTRKAADVIFHADVLPFVRTLEQDPKVPEYDLRRIAWDEFVLGLLEQGLATARWDTPPRTCVPR